MSKYNKYIPINKWAEDDRPREKMLHKGKSALSNAELIAILLRTGTNNQTALDLSKKILNNVNNNLIELSKLTVQELCKFEGIAETKAITIIAALEIGKRRRAAEVIIKKKISSSKDVFEIFHDVLSDTQYEEFWLLLLNKANNIIKKVNISMGGFSGTIADPKKIFKLALENSASSIILCHNHPSGNVRPSDSDIKLTKKLKEAGNLMDMAVLDHIIIGEENYYSFADESMI